MLNPVGLLLSFRGRISRRWFWLGILVSAAIFQALALSVVALFGTNGGTLGEIILMVLSVATAAYLLATVTTKRLRDSGRSPRWLVVYGAAPSIFYLAALLLEDPIANERGFLAVACHTVAMAIWLFALIDLGFRKGAGVASEG